MTDHGDFLEGGTLRFVRRLPGPIERVWAYLTEPAKRALWFADGETSPTPGGKVEFKFDHSRLSDHDDPYPEKYKEMEHGVEFEGETLIYKPPHLLALLWPEAAGGDDTKVTFRLSEEGDDVLLELLHERISSDDDLYSAAAGWHVHFGILIARLAGDAPDPFWAPHERLAREYEKRLSGLKDRLYKG